VRRNGGGKTRVPSPSDFSDSEKSLKVEDLKVSPNASDDNSMNLSSLAIVGELSASDQKNMDNRKDATGIRRTGNKVLKAVRFGSD